MLENKMLHGDCLTVTGNTLEENLSKIKSPDVSSNDIIFQYQILLRILVIFRY